MENILDYVNMRRDISFSLRSFNTIDALVFSTLAYVNWKDIVDKDPISIQEACRAYFLKYTKEEIRAQYAFSARVPDLAQALCNNERYNGIKLIHYKEIFDQEKVIQFSAVTFILPDESLFIAYRGTDGSIIGWKENMQMTYLDHLPCQKLACEYAKEVIDSIEEKKYMFGFLKKKVYPKIFLGGHSKGGNLAMYTMLQEPSVQEYIKHVYAFDAPGFRKSFWQGVKNTVALKKIVNYKPKDSIIGCLLEHYEKCKIIDAVETGLVQHDSFCWSADIYDFNYVKSLTEQSKQDIAYIDRILMSKSDEDKKMYIDLVFDVMDKLEINTINDMSELSIRQGINGLHELRQMSNDERKFLFEVINFLRIQAFSVFKNTNKKG